MGTVNKKAHQGETTIVAIAATAARVASAAAFEVAAEAKITHCHGRRPPVQPQAVQKPRCLMYREIRLMLRDPNKETWTEISMVCNPTGRITAPWRAPSNTHAPYPEDLPVSERAIWDVKSEAKVELATKLRALNRAFIWTVRDDGGLWEKWWLCCNQRDGGNW